VRASGNNCGSAELIRAADSTQLWSERYDRPLNDIFAVQDGIASAIVSELKMKLLDAAPKAKVTEPSVYALFMQAHAVSEQHKYRGDIAPHHPGPR
jgi:hypothetical protein